MRCWGENMVKGARGAKIKVIFQGLHMTCDIFTIRVPLFGHRIQGLCFCYLPNIKFKCNKFKREILDNSSYDHFHGGGDFSHAYAIMHTYFGKNKNANNEYISFYIQLNMFSCMKISCTFC
jgi:hypothetical protein